MEKVDQQMTHLRLSFFLKKVYQIRTFKKIRLNHHYFFFHLPKQDFILQNLKRRAYTV